MSPIRKIAAILICIAMFWNCSTDSTENDNPIVISTSPTNVSLKLEYRSVPLVDSLVLDCYGADTLHLVHQADDANFSLELFPSDSWTFKARLYANGSLMQMGELETKLTAGSTATLDIQMHAIVGFVYIEIPLGLNNSAGVKSGVMTLTSETKRYEVPMVQTAKEGVFKSEALALGANYDIEIILFDQDGKEIYKLRDKFLLTEESPVPDLTLQALRSQVELVVKTAPEKNVELILSLPAGIRSPKTNELLITEVMAAPDSKDTTQYEFVELYNGSLDTLILKGCSIGLSSSNTIKHFPITQTHIPPSQVMVLGNPNSANTPAKFQGTDGWNDLGNSKGTVILKCDGVTLDSLYYAPEPDSLHPNVVPGIGSGKYGLSSQLDVYQWENRQDSSAWKLGAPTPGFI